MVTQAANAAWQKLPGMRSEVPLSAQRVSLAEVAWDDYLQSGMRCRSSLDGSNPSVVEQVKARIADPRSFGHITTTLWPQPDGGEQVTMMFRTGNGRGESIVREARANVDPETCQATLISLS